MTTTQWQRLAVIAVTLCCCSPGCGPTSHTTGGNPASNPSAREDSRPAPRPAAERLARVRQLAVGGPDALGAPDALVEALADEDDAVKKVAAVALLSFGEKALPALRKKMPPRNPAPPGSPNPRKAPEEFLGVAERIVYLDPWFAGMMLPAAEEVAGETDPALRVVGVRALAVGASNQPERVRKDLRAAEKDPDERVQQAARELLKHLES